LNRLALGTVQFGMNYGIANQSGQVMPDEARSIVELSRASGFDTLDTAMSYGDSEQRLGRIGVTDWRIVSKLPAVPTGCGDISQWVATAVDESLQRLKTDKLYGLLLHRPQQLMERDGDQLYLALQGLKRDGRVQKIGISIYDPSELTGILDSYRIDLVQAPFNVLDRRLIETGWLQRLSEQDTELHVRSVFLQGLLLMKPVDRPLQFSRWSALWARWDEWLAHCGLTPLQACLRYALSFQQISKVIVGVDSPRQLEKIIKASVGPLPRVPDELCTNEVDLLSPANWK
jgi:aryl-alcohol dehydrogenase-like predicted oxidoreductase